MLTNTLSIPIVKKKLEIKELIAIARRALRLYDYQVRQNRELEDKIRILQAQLNVTKRQLQTKEETNQQLIKLLDTNKYKG